MAMLASRIGSPHSRVEATGSYIPERAVHNDEIAPRIDSTHEWIHQRTGIVTRHFAATEETAVDMAVNAARAAMAKANVAGSDIDAVVVACVTHPYQTPSVATLVAHEIEATPAVAFDVSAACSGFCHAVGVADDMIKAGSATRVLVIGVEKLSDFLDLDDRGSAFIFGDGAGAFLITGSQEPEISPTTWGSDGEQWDAIIQEPTWVELREAHDKGEETDNWPAIHMKGRQVFRWAVWKMSPLAEEALKNAGITKDDLDVFVPHQANMRIIDAMLKQLELPERVKVARCIEYYGNTSAASVPIALDRMIRLGDAKSGDLALLIGFGAGLSYAAQVIRVP